MVKSNMAMIPKREIIIQIDFIVLRFINNKVINCFITLFVLSLRLL